MNVYKEAFRAIAEQTKLSAPPVSLRLVTLADALEGTPIYSHEDVIRAVLHIPAPEVKPDA